MSNHSGSYMLNEVLVLLKDLGITETIEKEKLTKLLHGIVEIGDDYDCNNGEIFEDIGEKLGICYYCLKNASVFKHDVCETCANELYGEEDEE